MKKKSLKRWIVDLGICAAMFVISVAVGVTLGEVFAIREQITAVFIFSVFLVSLLTDGYASGIIMTVLSVVFINYAFFPPFYGFDFTLPENVLSTVIMLVISLGTSTLTTLLKRGQTYKARSEREMMRANLLRAVSHDLRTPLTTIYGSSSAIIDGGDSLTDSQRAEMLRGIREDSEWLIRIVENLLSVTKLDGGKAKILKSPTVLDELVDSVIVKFKSRYPDAPVNVSIPDSIVVIPMDPLLIEQVLLNMLENSVKHAEGMTRLTLSVVSSDTEATFSVADDGCGIDRGKLERLFDDRYSTSELSPDADGKNAGIGLSVCATIIKVHGGTVKAENGKDGGAVFSFTLAI